MLAHAQLAATVPSPMPSRLVGAPVILGPPDSRVLAQRANDALIVCALDSTWRVQPGGEVRFPAPWPRDHSNWALAPDTSLAVFTGVHALQAVDAAGTVRWEVRHGCWEGPCRQLHQSHAEYANRPDHKYPKSGSAGFSVDGKLVWAHVMGPLADDEPGQHGFEEWLVIDAGNGRVLAREVTETAAEGSDHIPHPADASQMGLSIGEGQDGAPVRWGRWADDHLAVDYIEDDVVIMHVSPSGRWLMTVSHDMRRLAIRRTYGVPNLGDVELNSEAVVPRRPEAKRKPYWEFAGGFLTVTALIASTEKTYGKPGDGRHWLIDADGTHPLTEVAYPFPVLSHPTALGGGTWSTVSDSGDALHVWTLAASSEIAQGQLFLTRFTGKG